MSKKLVIIGLSALAVQIVAGVTVDFRPQADGTANPGDGSTRVNVTVGSAGFPIDPPEVAAPFVSNANGTDTCAKGESWGGSGLTVGGTEITFTVSEIVDYAGTAGVGAFRVDTIGLGFGIDSAVPEEEWFMIDGQESFTWIASRELQWEGFTLRSFGTNGERALTVSSPDWIGLAGVSSGVGVTFDSATGRFTISNVVGNVAADGLTPEELVGVGGPTLDFTRITIANAGVSGSAIQTITFGRAPDPVPSETLPFGETFDALDDGPLHNQNGWMVHSGTAVIQTNPAHRGKAVELTAASISHSLSNKHQTVWASFRAWCGESPDADPGTPPAESSVFFYINTNQNLVVYSNTAPVVLDTVIPSNVWNRFDVYCDYGDMTWNLSVNQTNVAAGLPLYSDSPRLASVRLQNTSASAVVVDTLAVADQEPVADVPDFDGDSIPDWWEQKYFGGVTNAASTNLNAYIAGLEPGVPFRISGLPLLQWEGRPGRRYSLYGSTNLLSGFTLLQSNILWDATEALAPVSTNYPAMFYRVTVELEK